jgi:polysaccharide biosynthesis transport protein
VAPTDAPAHSSEAARRALAAAGAGRERAGELLDHLSAERQAGGRVALTVTAEESAAARRLAASYARAWAQGLPERARARAGPAGPARRDRDVLRAALIGAAAGLLAGLALALVREVLDVRRTSSRSIAARLGLEELGRVPEAPVDVEEAYRVPALEATEGAAAKAYAELAARVAVDAEAAAVRVILVCGAVAEDHGEQVAAGLGAALAGGARRVAVVELDPARATLRRQFALARRPGVTEVAGGETTLDDALTPVQGVSGLCVLAAGAASVTVGGSPSGSMLEALRERFDLVVVAGRPLLRDGGAAVAGADALLLAVDLRRTRHSRRPRLERVLERIDIPVLGFGLSSAGSALANGSPSDGPADAAGPSSSSGSDASWRSPPPDWRAPATAPPPSSSAMVAAPARRTPTARGAGRSSRVAAVVPPVSTSWTAISEAREMPVASQPVPRPASASLRTARPSSRRTRPRVRSSSRATSFRDRRRTGPTP